MFMPLVEKTHSTTGYHRS